MRIRYFLFFICLIFLSCTKPSYDYSHIKITRVIDGDTLVLENNRHLRLIGIDTPEIRKKTDTGFIYDPAPFSLEAKEFVKNLAEQKEARVEFDLEKKDKYNRLLGYCFIKKDRKEILLNEEILKEGFAVLYTFPPNVKYVDKFIKAQRQARKKQKGLWGAYQVISPPEAHKFIGQIRTVRGKVLSTYRSEKVIFLNFGQGYKTDFTVVIFKKSFKYFYSKSISPDLYYRGRIIEVTGRIREYNGPEIIVNSPLEINVID